MYIPVAEATEGCTPRLSNKGLKMAPPPRPKAPDINPPRKAKVTNLIKTEALSFKSLDTIPAPTLVFKAYSFRTLFTAKNVRIMQYTINARRMPQSSSLHRYIPIKDSNFLLPRNMFTTKTPVRQAKLRACLFHYL